VLNGRNIIGNNAIVKVKLSIRVHLLHTQHVLDKRVYSLCNAYEEQSSMNKYETNSLKDINITIVNNTSQS